MVERGFGSVSNGNLGGSASNPGSRRNGAAHNSQHDGAGDIQPIGDWPHQREQSAHPRNRQPDMLHPVLLLRVRRVMACADDLTGRADARSARVRPAVRISAFAPKHHPQIRPADPIPWARLIGVGYDNATTLRRRNLDGCKPLKTPVSRKPHFKYRSRND